MQSKVKSLFLKCSIAALICGGFQALSFLSMKEHIHFSQIILTFSFYEVSFILVYLIELSLKLLPFFLFQVLFGTYIYRHFCTASIYYFTRCQNRVRWFLKESGKLYLFAMIYPFLMVLSGTVVASITNQIVFDPESVYLFIYYLIIHSLWLFVTTLLVNIIAIKLDSSTGFIAIVALQMISVSTFLLWKNVWSLNDAMHSAKHAFFLKFNPISHLIFTWHSSSIEGINRWINDLQIDFPFSQSILVYLLLSIIVIIIGCVVVKRQEWISMRKEGGDL